MYRMYSIQRNLMLLKFQSLTQLKMVDKFMQIHKN